ncbi:helix-turn-helix domain-containing protein [Gemmata sp. JC717]|uniref:helix-turn-helix domain-containing protein n=1 Tax=Gemmata algarum TaxID=2975278 RepID=UPI0021BBA5EB|nr:helix-turn-helix domain-containing protein [Gemmata algarum]MDY3553190.1 helix-turn-helix domain-containing protein [Gemmata algarum]
MGARVPLTFRAEDRDTLWRERYTHPDPRVQRRVEVLWLLSQGETQARAGGLAGVSKATVERYVAIYRARGVAGLWEFHWVKPVSAPEAHRTASEESFQKAPPHTVAEARDRIQALTGLTRGNRRCGRV